MNVYETDLPGVGRKFDLELTDATFASVVVHHDGRCELYRRPDLDSSGEKVLELTGLEANRLGSILEGAYFESVNIEELAAPLGGAIIGWVEIPGDSALAGAELRRTEIRQQAGATVIAIQRDSETISNPPADFELAAGDVIVAIGTREEQAKLSALVEGRS